MQISNFKTSAAVRCALAVCLLTLLPKSVLTQSTYESSTETSWGIRSTTIETRNGKVTLNFPDDMIATDTIFGTVVAEAAGKNSRERERNSDELNGTVVDIAGQRTSVGSKALKFGLPATAGILVVRLLTRDQREVGRATIAYPTPIDIDLRVLRKNSAQGAKSHLVSDFVESSDGITRVAFFGFLDVS
jgi:hypothetical protein